MKYEAGEWLWPTMLDVGVVEAQKEYLILQQLI